MGCGPGCSSANAAVECGRGPGPQPGLAAGSASAGGVRESWSRLLSEAR